MRRAPITILFHGLVVLLVGLLCGVPYGQAITHAWGEEAVRAWRFAHFGLVVAGIWLMVAAAVSHLLVLNTRRMAILVCSVVTSAYGLLLPWSLPRSGVCEGLSLRVPSSTSSLLSRTR